MAIGHDIFVSYSKKDWSRVSILVEALRNTGFSVWTDKEIKSGDWSNQIDAALSSARHVLVFLTKESAASSYVFAEVRRARDRLVPVLLEDAPDPLPYNFDGLCAFLQQYRIDRSNPLERHPAFLRLCQDLKTPPGEISELIAVQDTIPAASDSVERWLADGPSIDDLAMAISIAVLETETLDNIRSAAQVLSAQLSKVDPSVNATATTTAAEAAASLKSQLLQSRSRQLGSIHAQAYRKQHPKLGIDLERCRFSAPGYGRTLLAYVWRELDSLRDPLCIWLADLATVGSIDVKWRLGFSLGILAQTEFPAIFDRLIGPWVLDETDRELRHAADIILSVAGYEPKLGPAIKGLLERWAGANAKEAETRAVVELVTGCTGGVFPDWAFATLRETVRASRDPAQLLPVLKQAMRRLVGRTIDAADTSLWDVDALLTKLADWVELPNHDEPIELPMFLFLCVLDEIPLTDTHGVRSGLSLAALVGRSSALKSCVRILSRALSGYRFRAQAAAAPDNSENSADEKAVSSTKQAAPEVRQGLRTTEKWFRDQAIDRLNGWLADRRRDDLPSDPVLVLARALVRAAATERDRDRIAFIFRHTCDPAALEVEASPAVSIEERP